MSVTRRPNCNFKFTPKNFTWSKIKWYPPENVHVNFTWNVVYMWISHVNFHVNFTWRWIHMKKYLTLIILRIFVTSFVVVFCRTLINTPNSWLTCFPRRKGPPMRRRVRRKGRSLGTEPSSLQSLPDPCMYTVLFRGGGVFYLLIFL